jgi:hypothetical protein
MVFGDCISVSFYGGLNSDSRLGYRLLLLEVFHVFHHHLHININVMHYNRPRPLHF